MTLYHDKMMQDDIATYKAEHSALRSLNNRLHAEIWILSSQGDKNHASVSLFRKEIEANTRRLRTIEYLMKWLETHAPSPPNVDLEDVPFQISDLGDIILDPSVNPPVILP